MLLNIGNYLDTLTWVAVNIGKVRWRLCGKPQD